MESNGWVRWQKWEPCGMTEFGQMPLNKVDENLRRFAEAARDELEKSGAAHVVYGVKEYDNDGNLDLVKFYLGVSMTDYEFDKQVASITGVTVYALHRRTA